MPVLNGKMNGQDVKVLRDTGCSTVVVKKGLVPEDRLTGRTNVCLMTDGTARRNPTAMIEVDTPYLSGIDEAVCMERFLYDVIKGNVPGVQETVSIAEVHACDELKEVEETQAVLTPAEAQREHKVKLLKVTESIDCNLSTEEIIGLQKQDVSLRKWWEEAQESKIENRDERKTVFEIKNGLLWRRKEEESKEVRQLV